MVIVLFSSCYQEIPVTQPTMTPAELVPVLKDIHLAEGLLTEVMNKQEKDSLARLYYAEIFRKHDVDTADFDQSMHAIIGQPILLDSIYEAVIQALNKEREAMKVEQATPEQ